MSVTAWLWSELGLCRFFGHDWRVGRHKGQSVIRCPRCEKKIPLYHDDGTTFEPRNPRLHAVKGDSDDS